jgi:hypothetical protein
MKLRTLLLWVPALVLSLSVRGQSTTQFIDSGAVSTQFDYLFDKSNRYENYKVVRMTWLQQLKANVTDSLRANQLELDNRHRVITDQQQIIDSLELRLKNSTEAIDDLEVQNEEIRVLGIDFKKSAFTSITFAIIAVLSLLLVIYVLRFKNSNAVTRQTRVSLSELEEEFNEHRKIALEREQKVRRQLQDELNKQKEKE